MISPLGNNRFKVRLLCESLWICADLSIKSTKDSPKVIDPVVFCPLPAYLLDIWGFSAGGGGVTDGEAVKL